MLQGGGEAALRRAALDRWGGGEAACKAGLRGAGWMRLQPPKLVEELQISETTFSVSIPELHSHHAAHARRRAAHGQRDRDRTSLLRSRCPQAQPGEFEDATKVRGRPHGGAFAVHPATEAGRKTVEARNRPLVVVGGGVSGVWAAITLRELGYTNVTILEKERRVGGKAASFAYAGRSTRSARWARRSRSRRRRSTTRTAKRLRAARSLPRPRRPAAPRAQREQSRRRPSWPRPFPKAELTAQAPVADWKSAFGAKGAPSGSTRTASTLQRGAPPTSPPARSPRSCRAGASRRRRGRWST